MTDKCSVNELPFDVCQTGQCGRIAMEGIGQRHHCQSALGTVPAQDTAGFAARFAIDLPVFPADLVSVKTE